MNMPNTAVLATSNISDNEINVKNPVKKTGEGKLDFLTFLGGKGKAKGDAKVKVDKNQGLEELIGEAKGKKVSKKSGKTDETEGLEAILQTKPNFNFVQNTKLEKTGSEDLGNRIASSKVINKQIDTDLKGVVKQGDSNFDAKKSNVKGEVLGKQEIFKVDNLKIKDELAPLHQIKGDEAIDKGLKVKDIANKSEIVVAKGTSPQSRGRVYAKNELSFKNPEAVVMQNSQGTGFSESDLRSVNTDLKMVGTSSYGLKKFNKREVQDEYLGPEAIQGRSNSGKAVSFEETVENLKGTSSAKTDFANVVKQVENGIKMHFNPQLKEMKIKLQPEELGEVDVKLKIENNIMKAEFLVESQTVKEALESKFNMLKENLEAKGLQATEINVYVSTGDGRKNESHENFQFAKKGRTIDKEPKVSIDDIGKIEKQAVRKGRSNNSSLDIFV